MVRVEANPTPGVLVWARESSGLTTEAAAKKVGVSAERLAAWESGEQRPTFAQLRKLGTAYKRPLAVFYLEQPPRHFAPMHDFRRAAERAELPNSPELTMEIRKAHGEVRRLLGVTLENQVTWRTDYEAFRQWRLLIERAGILTFQANDVDTAEARGFSVSDTPLPAAVTNIKDAPRGRIFTLLHETTHILLRDGGICDLHESNEDDRSRVEAFCNHVAGATLFPRDALLRTNTVLRHRRGNIEWTDIELMELSRHFGGSREAALVRLLALGLTTRAYYDEKREQFLKLYAEQRERERQKGGFAPPLEVALTSAGPAFTSLVVESFNRERITASDVADYLQIRLKHLADVQRDYAKLAV